MNRATLSLLALTALSITSCRAGDTSSSLVGSYASPLGRGAEIISIQTATHRAALASTVAGRVEILDLTRPAAPVGMREVDLALRPGEKLTSVAFHPTADYFAASIQAGSPLEAGRVELRSASHGRLLAAVPVGVGPDCVAIDAAGSRAVVANEAEEFVLDRHDRTLSSPSGSISIIDLQGGPDRATATHLALADQTGTPGFIAPEHGRFLERFVDVNGNGALDEPADLNGDGDTADTAVVIGTYRGRSVRGDEADGEKFLIPLMGATPDVIEPEAIAITPDGARAFVTLQEVNGIAIVDLRAGRIAAYAGLGVSTHRADTRHDRRVAFADRLVAAREPDGIAITSDGRYFVTADEGDTDPETGAGARGPVAGGGRTLSVYRTSDCAFVADTGNQIDELAESLGIYPDNRSDNKGSEPEMLHIVRMGVTDFIIVALERAHGVAVVSLADPASPRAVGIARGGRRPEGVAVLPDRDGRHYFAYTADEARGTVSVYRITRGR